MVYGIEHIFKKEKLEWSARTRSGK